MDQGLRGGTLPGFLPVIGICGSSGAGKTTLIEAMIPLLLGEGLRLAVIKHGAHGVRLDRPGKDSDRFFRAGADVGLLGEERFFRGHDPGDFAGLARLLAREYDLVLVEGHASTPVGKIWLLGAGHDSPPREQAGTVLRVLRPEERQPEQVAAWILSRLIRLQEETPLYGCVLIGGRSTRMGRPKHLLRRQGRTWLESAVHCLAPRVERLVLSGRGEVPGECADLLRIPDIDGLGGPVAGILAVMRWQPLASWLVVACDQPDMSPAALDWLLAQRRPGIRAVCPDLHGDGRIEPLLAWYDYRCLPALEQMAARQRLRLTALARAVHAATPRVPPGLAACWRNINTPDELRGLEKADGQ